MHVPLSQRNCMHVRTFSTSISINRNQRKVKVQESQQYSLLHLFDFSPYPYVFSYGEAFWKLSSVCYDLVLCYQGCSLCRLPMAGNFRAAAAALATASSKVGLMLKQLLVELVAAAQEAAETVEVLVADTGSQCFNYV